LEPAVPAGTIIVAENDPDESAVTDGGVVAIGLPSNVIETECDGIKLEPVIVTVVPGGLAVGDNSMFDCA